MKRSVPLKILFTTQFKTLSRRDPSIEVLVAEYPLLSQMMRVPNSTDPDLTLLITEMMDFWSSVYPDPDLPISDQEEICGVCRLPRSGCVAENWHKYITNSDR